MRKRVGDNDFDAACGKRMLHQTHGGFARIPETPLARRDGVTDLDLIVLGGSGVTADPDQFRARTFQYEIACAPLPRPAIALLLIQRVFDRRSIILGIWRPFTDLDAKRFSKANAG